MSTLESTICFSLVIIILSAFIVFPFDLWNKTLDKAIVIRDELIFHLENDAPVSTKSMDNYYSNDTCPELINTAIFGIIDSINIATRWVNEKNK